MTAETIESSKSPNPKTLRPLLQHKFESTKDNVQMYPVLIYLKRSNHTGCNDGRPNKAYAEQNSSHHK